MNPVRLFDIVAQRHDAIEKAAFLQPLIRAGAFALKRPLQTVGAVLTGQQVIGDSKKMMSMAGRGMSQVPTPSVTF